MKGFLLLSPAGAERLVPEIKELRLVLEFFLHFNPPLNERRMWAISETAGACKCLVLAAGLVSSGVM